MKVTSRIDRTLPKSIADHVDRFAHVRLSRFASAIREVRATVTDVNGPRGGVDTRCQLRVSLRRGGVEVLIQETAENVTGALTNAFERASHAVARRLDRMRDSRRNVGGRRVSSLMLATDP